MSDRRIQSLRVQNVLAVEHVELVPNANGVTIIAGRNGQGKSSLLRAIELLLEYRAAAQRVEKPLRNGQAKGWTELDLGDGVVVRRTFTEKSTSLTVKRGNDTLVSPQSFLDTIRPPDLLDPLAFSLMSPADRRALMIKVAGLQNELFAAEAHVAEAEDARLKAGRERRRVEAAFEELPEAPKGTPDEKVSASKLLAELQELQTQYRERQAAELVVEKRRAELKRANEAIEAAQKALKAAEVAAGAADAALDRANDALSKLPAPSEARGAELQEAIAKVDEVNTAVMRKLDKRDARERVRLARSVHEKSEALVDKARTQRDALIKCATLPLANLGFDEIDATYYGVRWASLGTAEQLKIGLALGAAQHPGLPVFVIHRGESLDDESLAAVDAWARENDVQVLMEIVGGEGHEGAFVIEAGRLK